MEDVISRQAAIDAIVALKTEHRVSWKDAVLDTLDELPSAQPKTGKWIVEGRTTKWYACSGCRGAGDWRDNYCKHCGAKMEVEQDV